MTTRNRFCICKKAPCDNSRILQIKLTNIANEVYLKVEIVSLMKVQCKSYSLNHSSGGSRRKSDRGSTLHFWAWWVWWAWLA